MNLCFLRCFALVFSIPTLLCRTGQCEKTGPVCFSCPSTDNPEECRTPVTCDSGQVCSVQETIQPHGVVKFWSGCESLDICGDLAEASQGQTLIGRRQTSFENNRCVYCCDSDLCNSNCSSFVNLALHKPAYQSSVASNGPPQLAVDGDTTKNYYHGSCMHTASEHYPWWAVDLEHEHHVTKVKLYERDDASADGRSFHLQVLVSSYNATQLDKDSKLFTQCGYYFGHSSDGDVITIDCPRNTTGRWVRVQQSDPAVEFLHLCEVEVFGF